MSPFQGPYAPLLTQFVEFKRHLGYQFRSAEYTFHLFDRVTVERGDTTIGITPALAEQWALKRPNESDSTRYRRVMYLIHFAVFLNEVGYPSYVPRLPRAYRSTFTPYIFSPQEIDALLGAADRLDIGHVPHTTVNVLPAVLRILYGTGIRVGEAVALRVQDVDLEDQYLIVHHSKNGRERLVPFSDSLADVLRQYRLALGIQPMADAPFFARRNGFPCHAKTIYEGFRRVLREAGISHGGKGQGPRLHDLRHVFAVRSLVAMAESGLDLYYALPILSEYLGHQSLEATDHYVRLVAEQYPALLSQVNTLTASMFPEVSDRATD